jgi:hypothetical protein
VVLERYVLLNSEYVNFCVSHRAEGKFKTWCIYSIVWHSRAVYFTSGNRKYVTVNLNGQFLVSILILYSLQMPYLGAILKMHGSYSKYKVQ